MQNILFVMTDIESNFTHSFKSFLTGGKDYKYSSANWQMSPTTTAEYWDLMAMLSRNISIYDENEENLLFFSL